MSTQRVPLPIQSYQNLIYLLCADCDQLHYFRKVPFQVGRCQTSRLLPLRATNSWGWNLETAEADPQPQGL